MSAHDDSRHEELLRQQVVLARFGELAIGSPDLDEILAEACRLVGEALGTDLAKVMELQADGVTLLVRAGVGWQPGIVGEVRVRAEKGSSEGYALQTGEPVASDDIDHEQRFSYPGFLKDNGVRALANVPVVGPREQRPYGILEVDSREPRVFSEADITFLRTYANLLAAAVQRLRLVEEGRTKNEALVDREHRLSALLRSSSEVRYTINADWSELSQLSGGEFLSDTTAPNPHWFEEYIPDEDRAVVRAEIEKVIRTGEDFQLEHRVKQADGSTGWAMSRAVPLLDAEGRITEWFGAATDITARRRAEHELYQLTETLEQRVEERTRERDRAWRLAHDLMVVVAADGTIEMVNAAWTFTLGWSERELLGRSFVEFTHPDDLDRTLEAFASVFERPLIVPYAYRFRHQDGSYRWFAWTGAFEDSRIYANGRDVTAERHKQAALEQAEEKLRQSQKMEAVGQLTGGLAHDFNNLLAGIVGSLDLLQRRVDQGRTADIGRYVNAAMTSANRAAALTHRLLAFSRRQTLDPKVIEPNGLVADLEDLLRRTVGPSIRVETSLQANVGAILCDSNQLENAVLNLAINARDAMPEGGLLRIETRQKTVDEAFAADRDMPSGSYVALSVSDSGTGMPQDVIDRAFDPFFTTKPLGEGTGLGLSMIYGFTKQSGGQVRIHSAEGVGTTVTLYLPLNGGDVTTAVRTTMTLDTRADVGQTVLVVDDEPVVRMLVVDVLQDLGYSATEAVDGISGLRQLERHARFDLLVTDVGLPGGMNGRQRADAARQRHANLKVLFITGFAESVAAGSNGVLDLGMQVLTKPFTVDALATKVREMIRGVQAG